MLKTKGAWHDPVWSKVISAIIIATGAGIESYLLHWWPTIGKAASVSARFLVAKTPVWNWLLGVVGIYIILTVIEAQLVAKKRSVIPPYTSDEFFGLRWKWNYYEREIVNLHCLCLACGLQVYFGDASAYDVLPRIASKCDDCGKLVGPFDGNYGMLESHVIRLIHRNLREAGSKGESGSG